MYFKPTCNFCLKALTTWNYSRRASLWGEERVFRGNCDCNSKAVTGWSALIGGAPTEYQPHTKYLKEKSSSDWEWTLDKSWYHHQEFWANLASYQEGSINIMARLGQPWTFHRCMDIFGVKFIFLWLTFRPQHLHCFAVNKRLWKIIDWCLTVLPNDEEILLILFSPLATSTTR